jgi:glycine cleavage system H protein
LGDVNIPGDLRFTPDDEWVRRDGGHVVVGITDYAQQQLGDIVFVELPEVDAEVAQGQPFGVIESVKAVSDLNAPLTGRIVKVNATLIDKPETVNEDCYGEGWMCVISASAEVEIESLLDAAAYRRHVDERSEPES